MYFALDLQNLHLPGLAVPEDGEEEMLELPPIELVFLLEELTLL